MNKNIFIQLMLVFIPLFTSAQSNYKVVFDLTSKDSVDQKNVIRWVNEISKSNPDASLEVVMYGQGADLVVKDKSPVEAMVSKLTSIKNVSFNVCAVAMKAHNIDKSQLITGVGIVPDGIYEIIKKQREGWGYIKVAH
ncbi:MAG: DsrE family protein [Ginsengibacter sp.]